jgi:hypothetical protein
MKESLYELMLTPRLIPRLSDVDLYEAEAKAAKLHADLATLLLSLRMEMQSRKET